MTSSTFEVRLYAGAPAFACGGEQRDVGALERRRREVTALLHDIRAPAPAHADIMDAIRRGSDGHLSDERLGHIAADIQALYKLR